jgi:hypothetical protein
MKCSSCKNGRFGSNLGPPSSVTRIGEVGTTLALISNRRTQRASVVGYS